MGVIALAVDRSEIGDLAIGGNAKAAQGMPGVAGAVTYDGERERGEYRGGCSEHVDDQAHAGIVTREAVQAHFLSGW